MGAWGAGLGAWGQPARGHGAWGMESTCVKESAQEGGFHVCKRLITIPIEIVIGCSQAPTPSATVRNRWEPILTDRNRLVKRPTWCAGLQALIPRFSVSPFLRFPVSPILPLSLSPFSTSSSQTNLQDNPDTIAPTPSASSL